MPPAHDFNLTSASKLLKLVLALQRKELVALPDAGHTDDILLLLRLANGDAELMAWAGHVTGAGAEELRVGSVAFVERVCFSGDNDAFGVLGLNPWANAEAVKEHYRLLIRIFHPDRGQVSNQTAETYAARINQAYAILKQQLADDGGRMPKAASTTYQGQPAVIARRFARPIRAENYGNDPLRWAARLTPARVLSGAALLAAMMIYLSFPQKVGMLSGAADKTASTIISEPAASNNTLPATDGALDSARKDAAGSAIAVALPLQSAEPLPVPSANVTQDVPSEIPKAVTPQPLKVGASTTVTPQPLKVGASTAVAEKNAGVIRAKTTDSKAADRHETIVSAVAANSATVSVMPNLGESSASKKISAPAIADNHLAEVNEKPVQARLVEMPSDRELHDLIASFMRHYANGDVTAFMQMFDEQVRTDEEGGKAGLFSTYASFFATTVSRSIVLKDLQWKKQGALAVAVADYRASTQRAGDAQARTSYGNMQIEVSKNSGRVMISGFFHQDAKM